MENMENMGPGRKTWQNKKKSVLRVRKEAFHFVLVYEFARYLRRRSACHQWALYGVPGPTPLPLVGTVLPVFRKV